MLSTTKIRAKEMQKESHSLFVNGKLGNEINLVGRALDLPQHSPMPTANQWLDGELHESLVAMEAVTFAASKEVRLPPLQPELESFSASLCGVCQSPGLGQVAIQEAPEVGEQIHTVWVRGAVDWRVVLEHCIQAQYHHFVW